MLMSPVRWQACIRCGEGHYFFSKYIIGIGDIFDCAGQLGQRNVFSFCFHGQVVYGIGDPVLYSYCHVGPMESRLHIIDLL